MEGARKAADRCRKCVALHVAAVVGVVVNRIIQGLADDIPLEGEIRRTSRRKALIRRPRDRAVIDNGMVAGAHAHAAVRGAVHIADTHTDITDDHILGTHRTKVIVDERDAVAGGCLTGNIHIAAVLRNAERIRQRNDAADIKHDRPGTLEGAKTVAQGAFLAVIAEVGDMVHAAAPAASCEPSVSLGCRECRTSHLKAVDRTRYGAAVCLYLIHTPVVGGDGGIALVEGKLTIFHVPFEFRRAGRSLGYSGKICTNVDIVTRRIRTGSPGKSILTKEMLLLIRRRDLAN